MTLEPSPSFSSPNAAYGLGVHAISACNIFLEFQSLQGLNGKNIVNRKLCAVGPVEDAVSFVFYGGFP